MPQLIAAENAVIALAFFSIFGLILAGLIRDRALGVNPLGVATAMVFFTCATGHAIHAEHYFLESDVYSADPDLWHQAAFDALTVVAGLAYLAQRRRYGLVIRGTHPMLDYQRRLQMAEALRDIGLDIAAETDLEKLLRRVVDRARDLLGGDYAAIVALDHLGSARLQVDRARTRGWDETAWKEAVFLPTAGGKLDASRKHVVVQDLEAAAGLEPRGLAIHRAEGGRSILSVPIYRGDRGSGALMVAFRSLRLITQDDVFGTAALASQAAVAIEKARLIEGLREADRLKDEFITAAAHELKTPITAIKGWTELILRSDRSREDQRKALQTIHRQAERIARMGEDLLVAVRLQPGVLSLRLEYFDLSALTSETVEVARRMDERHRFSVSAPGPLRVEADRHLIAEMLGRLLENAARYSQGCQAIDVALRRLGGEVVVSVSDHGIGIEPERQPHVFEPFYEPVPAGRHGYVGIVSLGLHLCKQIVEAHGGRIWFASTPEEGSTFSFSLPAAEE